MEKVKIGQGYWQDGYGRGFKKLPTVWNINGKAYVKDSKNTPYNTDLKGYIMCNNFASSGNPPMYGEVGSVNYSLI